MSSNTFFFIISFLFSFFFYFFISKLLVLGQLATLLGSFLATILQRVKFLWFFQAFIVVLDTYIPSFLINLNNDCEYLSFSHKRGWCPASELELSILLTTASKRYFRSRIFCISSCYVSIKQRRDVTKFFDELFYYPESFSSFVRLSFNFVFSLWYWSCWNCSTEYKVKALATKRPCISHQTLAKLVNTSSEIRMSERTVSCCLDSVSLNSLMLRIKTLNEILSLIKKQCRQK